MSPFLLANWRDINRIFCVLMWVLAVALAVVIIGHVAGASSACASKQGAHGGPGCAYGATHRGRLRSMH